MSLDDLALIRTRLANERTLLAYVRTALAFMAAGAAVIHFFGPSLSPAGWGLVALGAIVLMTGLVRFAAVKRALARPR